MSARRQSGGRIAIALAGAAWAVGCAAILRVDDVGYDELLDASPAEAGDAPTGTDAQEDRRAPDGAPCAPEYCLDGIDNDCNGLTDCQDPACSAYACARAVPAGWQPAALAATLDASCATTFSEAGAFNQGPDGAVSCGCACTATPGECVGTLMVSTASDCSNAIGPPPLNAPLVAHADAGCVGQVINIGGAYVWGRIFDSGPAADTCMAGTIATSQTVQYAASGTVCFAPAAGGGCQPSQPSCVPAATDPFSTCIARRGDVPCPAGAWTRRVIGARDSDGGSALSGDASCTACACTPESTCDNPNLTPFAAANCTPSPLFTYTDTCKQVGSGFIGSSYVFIATRNPKCAPGSSNPSGLLAFDEPLTVCCPP